MESAYLNGATEVVWRIEMQNCIFGEKSMYDLNIHVTKLALLGETAADWDSTAANEYHRLSADVSSRLQNIARSLYQ